MDIEPGRGAGAPSGSPGLMSGDAADAQRVFQLAPDAFGRIAQPLVLPADRPIEAIDFSDIEYVDWVDFERIQQWMDMRSNPIAFIGPKILADYLMLHGLRDAIAWFPTLDAWKAGRPSERRQHQV